MSVLSSQKKTFAAGLIAVIVFGLWVVNPKPVEGQTLPDPNVCYAIATDDRPQRLLTFNLVTGQVVDIGSTGTGPNNTTGIESLAYDRSSGTLYAVNSTTLGSSTSTPGTLGTLNKTTGAWSAVSSNNLGSGVGNCPDDPFPFDRVDGLATDPTGASSVLWAIHHVSNNTCDDNDSQIFQINPTTGVRVPDPFQGGGTNDYRRVNGANVLPHVEDIVMDIDGTLFGVTNAAETGSSQLITIDKTNGAATLRCSFSVTDVEGVTIANDGQMYISTGNSSSNANRIYRVDNRSTCSLTLMSSISFGSHIDIEDIACPIYPTLADVRDFQAARYGDRVLLEWQTGYEVDNLGFRIYREENGQVRQLNDSLVAGSALLAGPIALTAGQRYAWWDDLPKGSGSARYWIEDVDLSGRRTMHGPIVPVVGVGPPRGMKQAPLLSRLGRASPQSGYVSPESQPQFEAALSESSASQLSAAIDKQWQLAAESALKISISKPGWYRVSQSELVAAGFDPGADPRLLQLYAQGKQVPILVTGEGDGRFDSEDAIEFYGLGLDTPWTDTQVYWLVRGEQPGARITVSSNQGGLSGASGYLYTVERKERTIYFANLKNGEADNFFGPAIEAEPVNQILRVENLVDAWPNESLLEVSLQGVTEVDHRVQITLNGTQVGEAVFSGQSAKVERISIRRSQLRQGDNTVTLTRTGGEEDISVVDSVRLTYLRAFVADGDKLWVTTPGGRRVTISGFSRPDITVVDVTNPESPQVLMGKVQQTGNEYAVTVGVPWTGLQERKLFAFTTEQIQRPAELRLNEPSRWHDAGRKGEIVMLTHRDFVRALAPLKSLRESQGWTVAVVTVEDVYDEFNFSVKSPWAIKDFLKRAVDQWQNKPRFVVLVGDASFDPRNYLGLGDVDFVPTKTVATDFLETASDDWFADFDGDDLAELAIGRLPVRTLAEAQRLIAKLVGYEQAEVGSGWNKKVLLVADVNDGYDFEAASESLRTMMPGDVVVQEVYRARTGDARGKVLERISDGEWLVNYMGHGSVELWRGNLLTTPDARALTNGQRLPLVVAMTCLNGLFHDLYTESLAEALLKAERGGAIAVWASSGLTYAHDQARMNQELVRILFEERSLTLGEALVKAKARGTADLRRTWILFGDPVTRLK